MLNAPQSGSLNYELAKGVRRLKIQHFFGLTNGCSQNLSPITVGINTERGEQIIWKIPIKMLAILREILLFVA